ncbi:MFS transporter [Sinomonas sp. ASV322]|uniref:MFS transporter n=1 Tax=Sinomonas sp. ASV322 TaxID=3041920 RepID=UPI0027DBD8FC|nr:MFS transporter [Sinomonas sp. ASV322]MDQ4501730.1 MFS transporter [Sinomonas sp. ASV322]
MRSLLADISPLQESPDFRRLWSGQLLSILGGQLTLTAVSLQVYDLTHSSFNVGLLGLVALVPLIVAGLYGGAVVDAYDRRLVAIASSLLLWGTSALIALQAWLRLDNVPLIYALVALQALGSGINLPARSAIVPRLIRPELLAAANSLNMITFGLGGAAGPLLAGALVASVGYGWTYTLDVLGFTVAMWALFRLPPLPPEGLVRRAGLRSVGEGFRFLGTRPNIRMTFLIDLCAMVFAMPRSLLPAVAALSLGGGAAVAGALLGAIAAGTFLGGLFSGPVGRVRWQGRGVQIAVVAWGASILAFGLVVLGAGRSSPGGATWWVVPALACMILAGAADSVSAALRSTILQAATPDAMRGRLQGVFTVVVAGGPRLGDVFSGGLAGLLGEGTAVVVGALVCVVLVGVLRLAQPRFARYDALHPAP